jgi:uncharacterized protein YbjT (DUF2867 family)
MRNMSAILLAGASGTLGRHVTRELRARGYNVRRLVRQNAEPGDWLGDLRWPESLAGAMKGVSSVISCAGASMRLDRWSDRATFHEVDWLGHRNLIEAAREAGVRKFVYASVAGGPGLAHTEYAAAHEKTVEELASSGLHYTVVRLTGLYAFFGEILAMAAKGRSMVIGDGSARTNPIHESDAARACVDALGDVSGAERHAGGPDVLTRWEIMAMAMGVSGRSGQIRSIQPWLLKPIPAVLRLMNPRIAALVEFGTAVSQVDVIAPAYGRLRLEDYLRDLAALRKYDGCASPLPDSASWPTSRTTMNGSGFSPERKSTSRSFAAR